MCLTDKIACRRRVREVIASRSPADFAARSAALCERVERLPAYRHCRWLLAFSPLPDEVDIRPLLERALSDGHRVALPICHPSDYTMDFYEIRSLSDLRSGHYGIAEPPSAAENRWQPTADALCLVPALAYDRNGNRLGRGGGYYDRFLPTFGGIACGVCLNDQVMRRLPTTPTDYALSLVLTEGGIVCERTGFL